jgi:hypothetical protein
MPMTMEPISTADPSSVCSSAVLGKETGTVFVKQVVDEMGKTAETLRRVIPPKRQLTPTEVLSGARKPYLPEWMKPTVMLITRQWVRRRILVEGVKFSRFRKGDTAYINELIKKEAHNKPNHFNKCGNPVAALRLAVQTIIMEMFMPKKSLPYQIDHWYVDGKWKGLGLFATRRVSTKTIAKAFAEYEPNNCELVWDEAVQEGYDSVYTCNWTETIAESRAGKGWHQKELLMTDADDTPDWHIHFTGLFAVYGRLMFANHHDDGPFYFKEFKPTTPTNVKDRIGGRLTIDVHGKSHVYTLERGQQILVHYDFNLAFDDDGKFCDKPVAPEKAVAVVDDGKMAEGVVELEKERMMSPMVYDLTAEDELAAVMEEVMQERGRESDEDEYVPGKKKAKTGKGKSGSAGKKNVTRKAAKN